MSRRPRDGGLSGGTIVGGRAPPRYDPRMMPGLVQVEFLSRSWWWAAVVGVTGVALLVYAILLRREISRNAGVTPRPDPLMIAGISLATVSLLAGIGSLLLTIPVTLLDPL